MEKIVKSSLIKCSQEDLFNFHMDSNNITKITPPNITVELLNKDTTTFEGKVVKIKTTKFFVTTYWEVVIEKLDTPNMMVDVALKSPFKYWKHQHIFTKKEDGMCELKDIIEFETPFGFFGKLGTPVLKSDIESMFEYRHIQTKRILEEDSKDA